MAASTSSSTSSYPASLVLQQGSVRPNDQVVQEFVVRIPKNTSNKKYHVMRFGSSLKTDIQKWNHVKMERENNMKVFKTDDELPKFGAGSEFGKEQRDEARRKKHGILLKKYNIDEQPWLLKVGGKTGKKFKGIREGGVSENASYYVFTQAPDGAFEASPINEWYNFAPIHRYKSLSAEEAEEEFGRRDRVLNFFSIMLKKRLKNEDNTADAEEGEKKPQMKNKKPANKKKGPSKKSGDLRIMDDTGSESDDEKDENEDDENDSDDDGKSKGKKGKKKEKGSDDEAQEESDEGDFDDKEVDYMTDSSSDGSEEPEDEKANREMKGVEDEEALKKLDLSDDEEENPEEKKDQTEEKPPEEAKPAVKKEKKEGSSGESTSESSDSEFDDSNFKSAMFMQKPKNKTGSDNSANSSRASTPTKMLSDSKKGLKRKTIAGDSPGPSKKNKVDSPLNQGQHSSGPIEGISEEAVRRYLMRKPITTTELLQKFRSKKTGLKPNQLVTTIGQILKKLNPERQTIKGKMYLSIKS